MIEHNMFRNTPYWLNFLFAGQVFNAELNSSVTNGAIKYFEIITDSSFLHHIIKFEAISTATSDLLIEIVEAPTVTDGTTPIVPINMDRRKTKAARTIYYSNPTAISGGLIISTSYLGSSKEMATNSYEYTELLLKKATKYVVKVTNLGTATTNFYLKFIFYESSN